MSLKADEAVFNYIARCCRKMHKIWNLIKYDCETIGTLIAFNIVMLWLLYLMEPFYSVKFCIFFERTQIWEMSIYDRGNLVCMLKLLPFRKMPSWHTMRYSNHFQSNWEQVFRMGISMDTSIRELHQWLLLIVVSSAYETELLQ